MLRLAAATGLPLIHLDNEYWQPGWTKTPKELWIKKQLDMMEKEQWIIDGNYNSTLELRFNAAELIIFLDINRIVCLISVLKRHRKKRSDLPDYLEEKLDREFWEFIKWIWTFKRTGKRKILELRDKYPEKHFLHIKRRCQLKQLI